MIERISLLPKAVADATEAFRWYEHCSEGLGERFLACIEKSIQRIRSNPEMHEKVYKEYRRAIVNRFPYVIFFEVDAESVTVYSIFHTAQDPQKWRERLQ